jgi:NAD(P)-dependent dehydrogenase (short-subunit alcohol dehydrogenase family)
MKKALLGCITALLILVSVPSSVVADDEAMQKQKAVLITGASTGLGRAMAELLASKGHFVYAGARKDQDIAELSAIDNVQGIRLDVTVQSDIDAAVKTIIESKGRITTTGSISGILSATLFGPYSMSKHAMEAFTDSLAKEMARFDVKVSIIEPGNYDSKIGENVLKRMKARNFNPEDSLYREEFAGMLAYLGDITSGADPIEVAQAAEHALFDPNPKRRYLVVPNQEEAGWTINKQIEELAQLNQGHKYSYTRDQLVEMLDAALIANP